MRRTRLFVPLLGVVLLALAVEPALAADSTTERLISDLNTQLLAVAIPITLLVEGILFYTVWKYRNTDNPLPTKENRRLEITWTVTTAVVLLFVGFATYGVLVAPAVTATPETVQDQLDDPDTVLVEANGIQWYWEFNYPDENVSVQDEMVVPSNRTLIIRTTSQDVIHSFHAPELGLKADALAGQYNYLQTTVLEEGQYQLYCAEFCGTGHSKMLATINVTSPEKYQNWLSNQQGGNASA